MGFGQLYFFLFSGFQKRRFGIFLAAVSQWLGHKTCWGSAFSHARPKHLFLSLACGLQAFSLFLVGSKKQRFGGFLAAVCLLRFRMVWHIYIYISFFLMAPTATFRHFFGCGFAMAWAQNLLGFCLFACASKHLFLEFGLVACRFFLCF